MGPESTTTTNGADGAATKSTAELMRDLSTQLTTLIHQEMELAKAEVAEKTKKVGVGAGLFGGTAVAAVLALGSLVAAAIAGLSEVMAVWLAALIVTAILLAIAGVLALIGKGEVRQGAPPVPAEAVESTKEDVAWLKTQAQSAKP